jgi:ribosomal protection tetracycline resistance protein
MNAKINPPVFERNFFILGGSVSVAAVINYAIKFNATTSGKRRFKRTIDGSKKTTPTADKITF